jgi:hypothetical protein
MSENAPLPAELAAEAETAHRVADLTVGLGEQLLERAHELAKYIEERVCLVARNEGPPHA